MAEVKVYVEIEHIEDEDFDYWWFRSSAEAWSFIQTNAIGWEGRKWLMSNEPVGLPETEYTEAYT